MVTEKPEVRVSAQGLCQGSRHDEFVIYFLGNARCHGDFI